MLEGIKRSRAARQFRRLVKPGFGEPISGDELAQFENSWVQMRVDPAALTPTTPAAAKYALGWGKKKTKQVTVFGRQEGAGVGYNPRYRGKRSYDPLLCLEANSALLSGQTSARAAPHCCHRCRPGSATRRAVWTIRKSAKIRWARAKAVKPGPRKRRRMRSTAHAGPKSGRRKPSHLSAKVGLAPDFLA